MKIFFAGFIKYKWIKYLAILVWQGIVFLALYLEKVEGDKLLYPMWLSVFVILLYLAYDYVTTYSRHKKLTLAKENIDVTSENLPESVHMLEEDYQELIRILLDNNRILQNEGKNYREDMQEFITLWTHQVKTPLTALELMAQELDMADQTAVRNRLFEIEQYCDMILQYLRIDGKGSDYVLQEYQIRSIVNQSVKYFSRVFISKGISVKVEIPEENTIVTDEKWLVFALKQIISNALKYTNEGCITIDMPDSNSIRVTDTGIGISQQDLPRIFERGYTGYNGRKDKKATGIGLFLVKTIIEKLNGRVIIESEPGKGTSVTCNLTNL